MSSAPDDPKPLEQRPFSIRLPRPLLIGLTALSLIVAAVGLHFGLPIWRQHRAVQEVEQAGGELWISQGGPPWLRSLVGDTAMRPFDTAKGVYLGGTEFGDAGMTNFGVLKEVEAMELQRTRCTDAGLTHITGRRCPALRDLSLSDTAVSDCGLQHLKELTNLKNLDLRNTAVTDAGLIHLARLTNLEVLDLSNNRITDAGLVHLPALKNLRHLSLDATDVTPLAAFNANMKFPNRPLRPFVPTSLIPRPDPFAVQRPD